MSGLTLEALQARLEHELGAAGLEDRALAARVREDGRRLVFLLLGLVRASRLYAPENDALGPPALELAETLAGLLERVGVVQVAVAERHAYVNDVRLRPKAAEQLVIDRLAAELDRHRLAGFSFHGDLDAAGFQRLARELCLPARGAHPAAALRERLADLRTLELVERWQARADGTTSDASEADRGEIRARAARDARDTLLRLDAGWMASPARLRRVVIDLVDDLAAHLDRSALAPFAGAAGSGERHLVSVCQLSLMLGRALGLDEASLADLGVAALIHDAGYLTSRDREGHALAGVRLLLRQRGPSDARLRRLLAVLEHTRDFRADESPAAPPSLFARILRIAEDYDLLVAVGPPAERLSPSPALERMWAGRGRRYDPALLALFVRALGAHPPGTVLELSDGRWAVAVRHGEGPERWALPLVRIVRSATGVVESGGDEVDLGESPASVSLRRVVEPAEVEPAVTAACATALRTAA